MTRLVLIADSDRLRAGRIADACTARGMTCRAANDGASALEVALSENPVVLVAQLSLPLIEGLKLAEILRANPRTQRMEALYLADRKSEAEAGEGDRVIGPPVEPEGVAECVQALLSQRSSEDDGPEAGEGGVEGQLSQIALPDLLQLFHVSRRSSEGDRIDEELILRTITENGVVIEANGERYTVAVLNDWSR